ncbi:LytTR family DNA-binding domain-containing protein [Marinilongibacter aquaticus]|uniref:LytR/AlgR family response regulator transcription factor n=1 Tax=Marinilongibacter aquaticus TaxID=2975157 RepID=UPI0021BDB50A|nr:LytTR family DNA-binding domain-containing protein [Marinilongibacter aquaticus]UBM59126.1 LytTR family DNA-binding domain-containing protein [Marinilongibacter aquaticus]
MSTKIKCLIVDDEPLAIRIIKEYCQQLPELEIVGTCAHALEAKKLLESEAVDLVFLDINMPIIDGIAFAKTLKNPPQIVYTTAYKEFAHDAFDLAATDYLLKPFSLARFMVAVDKVKEKQGHKTVLENPHAAFLSIKFEGKVHRLEYGQILVAEAQGNNVQISTTQGNFLPTMTISGLEEMLPHTQFLRTHRSFIVNKTKIRHLEGNRLFVEHIEVPVGANYREELLKYMGV